MAVLSRRHACIVLGGRYELLKALARVVECDVINVGYQDAYSDTRFQYVRLSKYVTKTYTVSHNPQELVRLVRELKKTYAPLVLYPTADTEVKMLLERDRELLEGVYFPAAIPLSGTALLFDRFAQYQHCINAQIPVPQSRLLTQETVRDIDKMRLPCIVRGNSLLEPRFTTPLDSCGRGSLIWDHCDLALKRQFIEQRIADIGPVIASEYIPGGLTRPGGAAELYESMCFKGIQNNTILATAVANKRSSFPSFGSASRLISADVPAVKAQTERYMALGGQQGAYEFEWKYDARDHQYKFIEVNPRLGLTHPIYTHAGMNFPYLMYCDATGQPLPALTLRKKPCYVTYLFNEIEILGNNKRYFGAFLKHLFSPRNYFMDFDFTDMRYTLGVLGLLFRRAGRLILKSLQSTRQPH